MPIRSVPNIDLQYYLVAFDKKGNERPGPDAGGGLLSAEIKKALADGTTTDVFVLSHGWMGDMPAAVDQYDRWISAMAACARDRDRARQRWPNFRSLIGGFHWPSKPWGDESMDGSFSAESSGGGGEQAFVDAWADRIADTPATREALQVIFESVLDDPEPDRLTPEVVAAYKTLEKEAELGAEGVGGAPDADREPLDPLTKAIKRHKGDKATNRSAKLLAAPVSKAFAEKHMAWDVASVIGELATRKALLDALGSPEPPALLVTATHGTGFNNGDVRQLEHQGALVCQDWEGLASRQPLSEAEYVAAHDITNVALPGTVAFLFACYGAGTPKFDAFLPEDVVRQQQIAAGPFLSRLPQKLLLAGAAAVIGHVERAWTCSFQWPDAGAQTQVFKSLFDALAKGDSVGVAIEFFDQRCGAVSTQLVDETRQRKWGKQNDLQIGALWTAQMDARNYIVIGDPATRLST
jgi:hypothetical protein